MKFVHFLSRIREFFRLKNNRLHISLPIKSSELYEEEDEDESHPVLSRFGYTIEDKLGEGSFSYVVRAHSERHGRDVAVKIIKKRKVSNLYIERLLSKEIELFKILNHQNIMKFLNVTETRSFIYVITALAINGNLLDTIIKNAHLDEKRACRWFHHLVDGIAFCHGLGIVHRDLKCENLLLDHHNILKISHFSFARSNLPQYIIDNEENLNRRVILSSTFCGSYAYSCPEILLRRPYEPHLSDVWSMGVVLYAMLSGRLPFDDTNLHTLLQDIRKPVIFHEKPVLSEDVKRLILKILSPSRIRIYIPSIREDSWYVNTFVESVENEWNLQNSYSSTSNSFTSFLNGEPLKDD